MPDPLLYLKSMSLAAIISAIVVLMMAAFRRPAGATQFNAACVLALAAGIATGQFVLTTRVPWPPLNGLDRLLTIVIPAVLGIELFTSFKSIAPWVAWFLRFSLAAAIPRILLRGSVYLNDQDGWSAWQGIAILAASGLTLMILWVLLSWLSRRSDTDVSIALSLALATLCAGVSIMMAGYLKGGAAAFPLAAALLATSLTRLASKHGTPALIGIGVVNLFGVIFIGCFFGRLPIAYALPLLLAPLLCWVTELPGMRTRTPRSVATIRLILVAVPMTVVLVLVKRDFDRTMRPLLNSVNSNTAVATSTSSRPVSPRCRMDIRCTQSAIGV